MSTKMTIIEGNSNDKDNVRAYMVKGEPGSDGVSPTIDVQKTGKVATLTIIDKNGVKETEINDGVDPTVTVSKVNKVTTITITDAEGTQTATINDGVDLTGGVPTSGIIGFDGNASNIPGGYEVTTDSFGGGLPIGAITQFAGNTAPNGYLMCNGAEVSRADYENLFNVIGTTYGNGDGTNTFNLPDLKGRVPVGLDSTDTSFDTLGETGGEKEHTLTVSEMPSHNHGAYAGTGSLGTWGLNMYNQGSDRIDNGAIVSNGGGDAHNNLQPYIVLNYIIKY